MFFYSILILKIVMLLTFPLEIIDSSSCSTHPEFTPLRGCFCLSHSVLSLDISTFYPQLRMEIQKAQWALVIVNLNEGGLDATFSCGSSGVNCSSPQTSPVSPEQPSPNPTWNVDAPVPAFWKLRGEVMDLTIQHAYVHVLYYWVILPSVGIPYSQDSVFYSSENIFQLFLWG